MIIVKVGKRKIEHALKEYRQKTIRLKQLNHLRDKQQYIKPSARRRKELKLAKYKNGKNIKF